MICLSFSSAFVLSPIAHTPLVAWSGMKGGNV